MQSIRLNVLIICLIFIIKRQTLCFRCDRRPYGSITQPSTADGRFKLLILGAGEDDGYIPNQLYTVQLKETDGDSQFTSFMISVEGDMKSDPKNPRRTVQLFPGDIRPISPETAKFSDRCLYSVEQSVSSSKFSVEVYWQAPPPGSGCVTLRAMVAENEDVWYEDGTPLTLKICEDTRQPDDVTPQLNYDCQICDEAKYEVRFTGMWSRNTHPRLFPENDWVLFYSDMVGASHATDFILWAPGNIASPGLRHLAEYGNSTQLEAEITEKINDGVRTLIKGKGHGYKKIKNPTYSLFRVSKEHHLMTVAIGIHPSPDWFLGLTRFELCQEDKTWLQERELNLYPWDAGTDSGVSYESSNIETFPQDAVSRVQMSSYDKNSPFYEVDMKDLHPFGKLNIKLIRTYDRDCEEDPGNSAENSSEVEKILETGTEKQPAEPNEPSRYQNIELPTYIVGGKGPVHTDPESAADCPMSQWEEWNPCDGTCHSGRITGYKWRQRYHLVEGIAVEKYDPNINSHVNKEVPVECKKKYDDFERSECEEECLQEIGDEVIAERRLNYDAIVPGHSWNSKKRHLEKS